MAKLSSQAQAVLDATKSSLDWEAGYLPNAVAAAALRAAADQVVPEPSELGKELFSVAARLHSWHIRDRFLSIATELENAQ